MNHSASVPQEAMVALLFAAGSTIVVRNAPQGLHEAGPALLIFAGLCFLNCVAVDTWEWQSVAERPHPPHTVVQWWGKNFVWIGLLLTVAAILLLLQHAQLAVAIGGSTLLLLLVTRVRHRFSAESARLMADMSLMIVPLLLLVIRP